MLEVRLSSYCKLSRLVTMPNGNRRRVAVHITTGSAGINVKGRWIRGTVKKRDAVEYFIPNEKEDLAYLISLPTGKKPFNLRKRSVVSKKYAKPTISFTRLNTMKPRFLKTRQSVTA